MAKKNSDISGLVLLSKQPGLTSFSSLFAVKKALGTSKVGHTGTLDSFAQGLLVVCVGNLTRLASHITAFDKTYEAVIEFGKETDTLDPTGEVIKTADLPSFESFQKSLTNFTGLIQQAPPAFSALHVDGKRASDLVRQGVEVELSKRPVTVYSNEIKELKFDDGESVTVDDTFNASDYLNRKVHFARVKFDVSKGTYIRSLARDVGRDCNSAGHLKGLLRTRISCFDLKDAAAVELLNDFTIDKVLENLCSVPEKDNFEYVMEQIKKKLTGMTEEIASCAGLVPVYIKKNKEFDFFNGRLLKPGSFILEKTDIEQIQNHKLAVFTEEKIFAGVVSYFENRFSYEYVIPRSKS